MHTFYKLFNIEAHGVNPCRYEVDSRLHLNKS